MWKYRTPWLLCLVAAIYFLLGSVPVQADAPLLSEEEQDEVNRAIDRGVKYLLKSQNDDGSWGKDHQVGYTSLSGLALIECGVPAKDIQLRKAGAFVRSKWEKLEHTYQLSLAILFLDALGDPKDKVIIQTFAMRLICGQTATGGWTYSCPALTSQMNQQMFTILRQMSGDKTDSKSKKVFIPPQIMQMYPVLQDPDRLAWADTKERTTCNSNTHFAILALWAARRHNMPLERTMNLLVQRFRKSQNGDGGWGYAFKGGSSPAMSCVGLLGMAVGYGLGIDNNAKDAKPGEKKAVAVEESRYRIPHDRCIKTAEGIPPEPTVRADKPEDQTMLAKGFNYTMKHIGQPANRMKDIDMGNLYHLWALERVCVLFNLRQVGDRDWYRWVAEMLVANQDPLSGAWEKECGYPGTSPILNTGMALLILKRANLASDLSRRLPFDPSQLNQEIKKVDAPTPTPPLPTPKVETAKQPEPPPKAEPVKAIEPTPTPTPAPVVKEDKSNGMLIGMIIGGIALLLLAVGGIFAFLYLNKKDDEEEDDDDDDKPKKKKKADSKNGDSKPGKRKKSASEK